MLDREGCLVNEHYLEKYQSWLFPVLSNFLARAFLNEPKAVVDLGVGPGMWVAAMTRAFPESTRIIGLDCNPAMLSLAESRLEQAGLQERVELVLGDVHELEFVTGSVELLVSWSCFHHWENPVKGLSECWRVIAPGGWLVLFDAQPDPALVPYIRSSIAEPAIADVLVKSVSEALTPAQVRNLALAAGIPDFEVRDYEIDMEDVLACMDFMDEPLQVMEEAPVSSPAWLLTARKS